MTIKALAILLLTLVIFFKQAPLPTQWTHDPLPYSSIYSSILDIGFLKECCEMKGDREEQLNKGQGGSPLNLFELNVFTVEKRQLGYNHIV